jgi:NitT/TauT family transport system substrate-binding protein
MVVCTALVVAPESNIYMPSELANRMIGLDYGNGTSYTALQMLEGFLPRDDIRTCAVTESPVERYRQMLAGEFDAVCLQEPWITMAEKAGCRLIAQAFYYGAWVADDFVDADTYAAFLRAVTEAVHRINANKRQYLHYFLQGSDGTPELEALSVDDFNLGRIQLKIPEPTPENEARRNWEWMASWGMIEGEFKAAEQFSSVQDDAHEQRATTVGD